MNEEIILTKNSILQKTVSLLSDVQDQIAAIHHPDLQHSPPGKISKGENYLGLPYIILDYPRIASKEDLFFIRSFFWWGHFFSNTLQVSGKYKEKFKQPLLAGYKPLAEEGYFIGANADPWQHHFTDNNYIRVSNLTIKAFESILEELPHTKLVARWPLSAWESAATNLVKSTSLLVSLIS